MEKIIKMLKKYKEVISYLIFGVLSTLVNFVTYFIFAKLIGLDEIVSNIIAWIVAVLFAYTTNKIFVFESKNTSKSQTLKELISFLLARIFTLVLCDIAIFALLTKVLHINDLITKLITQVLTIIINYVFSKLVVFKKNK